ncbi:hypothetical protein HNO88_002939 [Novosphingobium chloroacetimidivorans]|uniref:Uncharacterized protein n=1 Tax=Novosphingobium chloroacetimidivorans TaxID=1428314 RepID=A0A7W7NXV7_9SPHN|nr:hypothetical protein [Novosphingobium chloroacetimidivorans]MBB4859610.1 hypothetical protein [Novosphingobium chloroacetimidivorans]
MKPPHENAARALCKLDGHPQNITMNGKPMWQDYLPEVIAVLTAIRTPSHAMLAAADALPCSVDMTACWQTMIDTALAETAGTATNITRPVIAT